VKKRVGDSSTTVANSEMEIPPHDIVTDNPASQDDPAAQDDLIG
jgi:hypothetical protein